MEVILTAAPHMVMLRSPTPVMAPATQVTALRRTLDMVATQTMAPASVSTTMKAMVLRSVLTWADEALDLPSSLLLLNALNSMMVPLVLLSALLPRPLNTRSLLLNLSNASTPQVMTKVMSMEHVATHTNPHLASPSPTCKEETEDTSILSHKNAMMVATSTTETPLIDTFKTVVN